ncbi:phospholipase A1-Igamma1, chloroplastic-like [Zingiber officinale]|uniref:phospholipase A1-Igamma1, chloroplastic-like n=1 Tax=Zingiber officinale TaxID=94328 RepID=UPI001C4CE788|nr:phospholipase A1-Igamma1, chloroplastic-like [Zingiber officinale]
MALPSSSSPGHYSPPLSDTMHSSLAQAIPRASAVETPQHQERRLSASLHVPTTLSNLLHLHVGSTHGAGTAAGDLPTPAAIRPHTPAFSPKEDISSLFQEIHGRGDWSGLLHPLHPWLRREIIKYGELAQVTYDGFDFNPFSEFCGSCLYGRDRLLAKVGLARTGYTVTKYVYAMSQIELPRWLEHSLHADAWSTDSNWMGFVAVSDDAESRRIGCRDIVVAWRGTKAPTEWFEDIQATLRPLGDGHGDAKVERGFLDVYTSKSERTRYNKTSASEQVMAELRRLVNLYLEQGERVTLTITGHSLGGALALLNAYEAASALPEDVPVSVISFAGPQVGNAAFGERLREKQVKVLRAVVKQDLVPRLPGILFNERLKTLEGVGKKMEWVYEHVGVDLGKDLVRRLPGILFNERLKTLEGVVEKKMEWVYEHVGIELGLDVKSSPFLKHGVDVAGFHHLETYLHLVDGFVSRERGFRREARRDVALVNKGSGMLREELRIPPNWSQAANKGMVRNSFGRWVKPEREAEDIPSPYREVADALAEELGRSCLYIHSVEE